MLSQRELEVRNLDLHRIAARKLQADPSLLKILALVVADWHRTMHPSLRPILMEWSAFVALGVDACVNVALEDSEHAALLRRHSPLMRLLTLDERFAVLNNWNQSDATKSGEGFD